MLPILLIVLVTFFSSQGEPVYSLAKDAKYTHQLNTGRLGVSFWVKDRREFDKTYPLGHHKRLEVERHVSGKTYCTPFQLIACACTSCCFGFDNSLQLTSLVLMSPGMALVFSHQLALCCRLA